MTVWIQNPFDVLPCEGGRKQRYWLMAEAFLRAGHDVVYFTSDFSHALKRRRMAETGGLEGLRVVPIATPVYKKNVGLRRVWSHLVYARRWASVVTGRPDLIVSSFPTLSAAEAALRLGRKFDARVVIDVQDAWPETFERLAPHCLRALARIALWPLRRRARDIFAKADSVTGTCERYRTLVARRDYIRAYLGIEIGAAPQMKDGCRGVVRLAYVGNLGRSYDLETVLQTVEANPDFTLDVAGFGDPGSATVRTCNHGMLSDAALRDMLSKCDVGIIPMSDDSWVGMPNKLFDYARAGLRIVSSLSGESAELIGRYGCGATYRRGDVKSLTDAIRKAMALPAGASRRMCEDEFDARAIYREYVRRVTDAIA